MIARAFNRVAGNIVHFKYCQKTLTKMNVLTEVSAKGYLLIHKFLYK